MDGDLPRRSIATTWSLTRVPTLTGVTDATKNQILGEAYFLRALSYHNLVKFWGDVPMPLAPVAVAADAAKLHAHAESAGVHADPQRPRHRRRALITNTTDTRRATRDGGRRRSARACCSIARACRQRTPRPTTRPRSTPRTRCSPAATRSPCPSPICSPPTGPNTAEDIFRVSFTASEYNELGYYYLYAGRREARPTTNLDARVRGRGDAPRRLVDPRSSPEHATLPGHEVSDDDRRGASARDPARGVVLIKAEALARQDKLADAVDEYNKVRVRAGLAPHVLGTDVTTQADVLRAIMHERRSSSRSRAIAGPISCVSALR